MASLFAARSLPGRRHHHLLFPASSSHPIGSRRYLVFRPSCSAREVLDVTPQRDDGRRPRTEEGRAGCAGVRYGANGGTVRRDTTAREAGTPVQREGRGVPRVWKKGDRVVVEERPQDRESQEKNWRRGTIRTGEQEWRRDANRWRRDGKGMWAKEPGNAGNSRDEGRESRNATKKNKRVKGGEQGGKLRVLLDMCSKRGDVMTAISLYDSAVEDGIRLGQHHYNVLLYLCSSAALGFVQPAKSGNTGSGITCIVPAQKLDSSPSESLGCSGEDDTSEGHVQDQEKEKAEQPSGDLNVQTVTIPIGDDLREYARARGFEIFEKMCAEKERVQMSEAALTAKARMALSMGDGDMAFEIVKQMKDLGITPKLRSYGPALTAFCSSGNVDKAFEVEAHMLKSGITPEEAELEMLLRVSVVGRRGDKVYNLLHKFRAAVRQVSPSAAQLFEDWFRSPTASKVGKRKWDAGAIAKTIENNGGGWHGFGWLGRGKWTVTHSNVNKNGVCLACGEKLTIIDLDPNETEDFATFVAKLAIKRERNSNFEKFQKWLEKHGPFEAVVDAANVGLFSHKHLSLSKVNAVADAIRQKSTSRKWPLIVLHNRHLTGERMRKPGNHKLVDKWKQSNSIYATPNGSNDDWYWLYAAIRCKCLIITNDEMRDHTFQILEKGFFPKWKERHQESEKGHFHIPLSEEGLLEKDRTWLCVMRRNSQEQ